MNEPSNVTLNYRVGQLEEKVDGLSSKVDKLTLAIVGGSLTTAVSAVVFALTVLQGGSA